MKDHQRFCVIVVLAVLGNASAAYAQTGNGIQPMRTTTQNGGAASQSSRTARVGVSRADALRPYRARALAEAQMRRSKGPLTSSWQQQRAPVQVSPQPAATAAGSHNYYPTMRPDQTVQQPVTLTVRSGFIPFQTCTGGGLASGVGGRHR